jgi:hypothetical protein
MDPNDPTAWPAGKRFGELSPEQKIAVAKRAAAQLQDELQRNSAAISAAMDAAEAGELDEPIHAPLSHFGNRMYDPTADRARVEAAEAELAEDFSECAPMFAAIPAGNAWLRAQDAGVVTYTVYDWTADGAQDIVLISLDLEFAQLVAGWKTEVYGSAICRDERMCGTWLYDEGNNH